MKAIRISTKGIDRALKKHTNFLDISNGMVRKVLSRQFMEHEIAERHTLGRRVLDQVEIFIESASIA